MSSPVTAFGMAGAVTPPVSVAASAISCLLFTSFFISGQAEGFSLAAAKDASRFITTSTAVPSRFEPYQPDFRGIKAAMQATNVEGQYALAKHHQHSHHDLVHPPSPDFEHQLEQLKENHGETISDQHQPAQQQAAPVPSDDEPPVAPISRKDELFTPGLGVEEVSFLGPIRRLGEGEEGEEGSGERRAAPGEVAPLQPDLLESEADVLEELKKLSSVHDAITDPLLQLRPEMQPSAAEEDGVVATQAPPMRVEKARIVGIGGATGDHFVVAGMRGDEEDEDDEDDDDEDDDEDDLEGELEEEGNADNHHEEVTTQDPEEEVISLEERLSASLRELAELRRKQSHQSTKSGTINPAPSAEGTSLVRSQVDHLPPSGPGVASSAPGTVTASPPGISSTGVEAPLVGNVDREMESHSKRGGGEGRGPNQRAAMRKVHMARKLMDPEDPKKDEDLLELMLRIAENPDEWKRVHSLLRQLDDDLTTYEKTMHRVQALANQKSMSSTVPLSEKDTRREEMSRSGLPAGLHGEALPSTTTTSTTTQHPLSTSSPGPIASHHKDWPKFAYHRVTSAPLSDPFLLVQQQQQQQQHHHERDGPSPTPYPSSPSSMHRHRNAYIAVSIITPPSARGGKQSSSGAGRPLPSPPPMHAVPPTYGRHLPSQSTTTEPSSGDEVGSRGDARMVAEETLGEPMMGEEEVVDRVAGQESSMHRQLHHQDQVEEQLRALAAVEEKLRHQLHEKERMRHLLKEIGDEEGAKHHRKSKRSIKETAQHQHHLFDRIAFKTS